MGDPDGDGYPTSFEEAWGSDPQEYTSFEDLKNLEGTISFVLHVREPYNVEHMNMTVYQQVNFIKEEEIEDTGWWDKGPFNTLTVDAVLFPYVAKIVDNYVRSLSYPYEIAPGLEAFQFPTSTSDSCQELTDVISPLANQARTLYQLGNLIQDWNHTNLSEGDHEDFGFIDGGLREKASVTTSQMIQKGLTLQSTTRANLGVSEFREAGIPSGVAISFDPTDVDAETNQEHILNGKYRASHHPQTAVWTPKYGFVLFDYNFNFGGVREPPYYVGLFIQTLVPDYSDANDELRFNSDSIPNYHPRPAWLFYIENLQAPEELLSYLQPADW